MMLSICAFLLGCWIIFHHLKRLSFILFALFLVALGILIFQSSHHTRTLEYLPDLAIMFLFLAICGKLIKIGGENKIAQVILLIFSVIAGHQISQKLKTITYRSENLQPDPTGEILLEVAPGEIITFTQWVQENGGALSRAFYPTSDNLTNLDDYYILDWKQNNLSETTLAQIKKNSAVWWAEWNEVIPMELPQPSERGKKNDEITNDPSVTMQWHLHFLEAASFFKWITEKNITPVKKSKLFILDTGIDGNHEDLAINRSFTNDKQGHGTHCAGVAAAITNNRLGIASLSPTTDWIEVHGIKVIGDGGFGIQKSIIEGIIQASDAGADVISLSLGGITNQEREKAYNDAVSYANKKGAIVVVAAGNANLDAKRYSPANTENVITVTSVNEKYEKSGFSNHVQNIHMGLAAPGERILSTTPSNTYTAYNGTSMATPLVAGLIAILKAVSPDIDTQTAFDILSKTGKETQNTARTGKLINPEKALREVMK